MGQASANRIRRGNATGPAVGSRRMSSADGSPSLKRSDEKVLGEGGAIVALGPVAVVGALYAARVLYSGQPTFGFVLFNVALAAIPLLFSSLATLTAKRWPLLAALALVPWLLFLPNAPYLLTDLIHLAPRSGAPLWYDAALLGTAAVAGLLLGVVSLAQVRRMVAERFSDRAALAMVLVTSGLCGYGIYLGRFLRLNSWDVALHPMGVLHRVMPPVLDPLHHLRAWVVTAIFGAILTSAYLAYAGVRGERVLAR